MKLYLELFKALLSKIRGKKNGEIIKKLASNMGIVYIKLAQILSTQNYGNLFTEEDRKILNSICDDVNPIEFDKIEEILNEEYDNHLYDIFESIEKEKLGSASISQVHKAKLKTGETVAIKVKRIDVTSKVEKDINQIKKLMYKYGKFFKFGNFIAGEEALNLYLDWIKQEIDFENEVNNINLYTNFANEVNGKIENSKKIIVPKVYNNLCTKNVIVMEYIPYKTLNKLDDTKENKVKIKEAMNSYIKSNFYALFNNKTIVYHADPHEGNVFLDDKGNVGFLDMGLCYELTSDDTEIIKKLFLCAFSSDYEGLYDFLIKYGKMDEEKKLLFKEDIKKYCEEVKDKEVSNYFTDVIYICLKYEFLPPKFLFIMAKTFMLLNGISAINENMVSAKDLLRGQTTEYLIKENLKKGEDLVKTSLGIAPNFVKKSFKAGLIHAAIDEIDELYEIADKIDSMINEQKLFLKIIKELNQSNSSKRARTLNL